MSQAVFLTGGLMRHVATMSLTASVGIVAIFAVDFVDMIFIAMLGEAELASAIGYAGTVLFFTNAINIGLSIAAGTLVAQALGRADEKAAREHATAVGVFALMISVVIPVVVLSNLAALLGWLGAAYASVLARLTMAAGGVWYVIRAHNGFAKPSIALIVRDTKEVSALAGPAVLTNLATPVGTAIITREMAKFGTEAVAAMAVIGRLTPLAFAAVLAVSGAIGPIVGQNYGAGQFDRVRGAFKAGLIFVTIYVVCVTVILFFARPFIADLFEASGEMRALIFLFCGPLALFQIFNGAIFVCNASFNNLGHPYYSTLVNWGRHTLGTLPFALGGAAIAGASGVLIGQAVGGVIFAVIGVVLAWRLSGSLHAHKDIDDFAKHQNLHQVTTRRNW